MLIAVISDVHDNVWALEKVMKKIRKSGAEELIFCGDACAPFTIKTMANSFEGQIHTIWGNNDGDRLLINRVAGEAGNVKLHGDWLDIELGGRKIAANHYPWLARKIAQSGDFDVVFYGHDHKAAVEPVGNTLLMNPGEVMGRKGKVTFGLYDTKTGEGRIVEVEK